VRGPAHMHARSGPAHGALVFFHSFCQFARSASAVPGRMRCLTGSDGPLGGRLSPAGRRCNSRLCTATHVPACPAQLCAARAQERLMAAHQREAAAQVGAGVAPAVGPRGRRAARPRAPCLSRLLSAGVSTVSQVACLGHTAPPRPPHAPQRCRAQACSCAITAATPACCRCAARSLPGPRGPARASVRNLAPPSTLAAPPGAEL